MLNKLQFPCKIFPDFLTIWNHSKLIKLSSMTPLLLTDTVQIFLILYNLSNRINEMGICILKTVSLLLKFKGKDTDKIQINRWAYKTYQLCVYAQSLQSCLILCNPVDCSLPGSSVHRDSPGKNTGVGCHALLQEIFPYLGIQPRSPAL